jgi:hypothetical protein
MSAQDLDTIRTAYEKVRGRSSASRTSPTTPKCGPQAGPADRFDPPGLAETGRATGVGTAAQNPITQSEEERMQWTIQLQLVGSRWA